MNLTQVNTKNYHLALLYLSLVFILIACNSINTTTPTANSTATVDPIVARVNQTPITQTDLDLELAFDRAIYFISTNKPLLQQDPMQKLERLTSSVLIDQLATQANLTATEQEIDLALNTLLTERNSSLPTLETALKQQGVTLSQLKNKNLARTIRIEKYLTQIVTADATTTDEKNKKMVAWVKEIKQNATIEIIYKPPAESPTIGAIAPDFSLLNLNGKTITLSELKGKPIIINFWATWCGPCRQEMFIFEEIFQTHQTQDLIILAINYREQAELVEPFVTDMNLSFEILYDSQGKVNNTYLVTGLPRTIFIDRTGVIKHIHIGELQKALLEGYLNQIL